jgi:hypothetical protein
VATTATPSRITATTRAFPLVAYFVLAYALSWLILVPAGLGLLPDSFALPRLQDRHSPLLATTVLAVVWGMWHLPNVLFGGCTGPSLSPSPPQPSCSSLPPRAGSDTGRRGCRWGTPLRRVLISPTRSQKPKERSY